MKYIDISTVVNSYEGFQNCMTNKSWGYLALLKGCDNYIRPSVSYEVDMNVVSNFLEGIFNLSSTKRQYSGGRSLFVVFSNIWENYFNAQGQYTPNIYDIAAWAYRRKAFNDNVTEVDIIKDFTEEFHIASSVIEKCFDTKRKGIIFASALYSESNLKSELRRIGVDVSKDNIDAKKGSVVASPGEISRGPFVQTLYAGLDITEYVLILQSDYDLLYGNKMGKESTKRDPIPSILEPTTPDIPITVKLSDLAKSANANLPDSLLEAIKKMNPKSFEVLIARLLVAMGYGKTTKDVIVTQYVGDYGIDGYVRKDRLDIEKLCVYQAKRYTNNKVGIEEMNALGGAMINYSTNCGIFVTTSDFTPAALKYDPRGYTIKHINGQALVKLLIEYGIGIKTEKVEVKTVDTDFLNKL